MGFAAASTDTLLTIRTNLLAGLDRVAASLTSGAFYTVGPKGAAPPSQSGHLTLLLLQGVEDELNRRDHR